MSVRLLSALVLTLAALGTVRDAHAAGAVCQHVEPDLFEVDGMLDDWRGFRGRVLATRRDAGLVVRCAYDESKLYLSLNIRDERVVRTRKARARAEDRAEFRLDAGGKALRFSILPGSRRAKPKTIGNARGVAVADSLQPQGWSVEAAVPLQRIRGWSRSVPYLRARLAFHDADRVTERRAQDVLALDGRLHFSESYATFKAFLRAAGIRRRDVTLDVLADVDPGAGRERVVVGGGVVGVLSDGFSYIRLPVAKASDVIDVRVVDLDGSGRSAIIGHLRQHGNGGSRELVSVWFAEGDGSFTRSLAFEVAKRLGDRTLESEWRLVPRGSARPGAGKRRKRRKQAGYDILIEAGEAVGWDARSYREVPAADVEPILLPWSESTRAVYYFEGTAVYGGAAP